ncbi:DUF5828 family protein [Methanonatronarchaeum sp. AMET-Sl]|uniref:DUF5828 family protein n=1 Tax=Methanonatronarchaeum sp. AMET-Sl TaxID=3037654 RepID=UPI00244DF091|nr:DUF5828 family protein [Methanonatronarchaeum sp. AMET-Sl]WGI17693.1 DUF5828 family protein [Methanonatronarchaeum sp. AMET-Sl]
MVSTTLSGMKVEGEWNDVVETSREVSKVLEENGFDEELDDWNYWRPREEEDYSRDLVDKTAQVCCTSENSLEKADKKPGEEARDGLKKVKKAIEDESPEGNEELKEGVKKFYLSADTVARKMVRNFEKFVFKNVISKTNPQFFDSEPISANIKKKNRLKDKIKGKKREEYVMEINVNDTEVKEKVMNKIDEGKNAAG